MKNSISFTRGVIRQAVAGLGLALCVSTTGFADVSETRDLPTFDTILIKGGLELDVHVGKDLRVEVTTDEDYLPHVYTTVENGVLTIDTEERDDKWFGRDPDVAVDIHVPSLKALDVQGAVDGFVENIAAESFLVDVRGAGGIELKGTCGTITVELRGAGAIEADDLECANAIVELRGTGLAEVYASENLKATLRGIGAINVYGNPKNVDKEVRGIGMIDID